jgi:hypothetical protein
MGVRHWALDCDREHLSPDPKTRIGRRRPGQDAAGHVEKHVGGIERLAVERLAPQLPVHKSKKSVGSIALTKLRSQFEASEVISKVPAHD